MEHLYYDLGRQKKGAVAVVTRYKQANVRLMAGSNYRAFKSDRQSRFHGGLAKSSPARRDPEQRPSVCGYRFRRTTRTSAGQRSGRAATAGLAPSAARAASTQSSSRYRST